VPVVADVGGIILTRWFFLPLLKRQVERQGVA
jgi:hypothetical protein